MFDWSAMTSAELQGVDREVPVLVPLGIMESHGAHLPNGTDSATVDWIVQTATKGLPCLVCPTLHYGYAGSSYAYPGTLGLSLDAYTTALVDIVDGLVRHGFYKVIFISGHGDNGRGFQVAVSRLTHTHPHVRCVYHNWWTLGGFHDVHHADAFESETAAAMGIRFERELAVDVSVAKSWYTEFNRAERYPDSGGVNGNPSQADPARGQEAARTCVRRLRALIDAAYRDK